MKDVTRVGREPTHRVDAGVARDNADMASQFGLPAEGRLAAHGALEAAGQWQNGKQRIVLGHQEIVNHARIGRLEAIEPRHLASAIDDAAEQSGRQWHLSDAVAEKTNSPVSGSNLGWAVNRPAFPA